MFKKLLKKKVNKKGFTLAELLIVVAIIAVLVAIAIPIFTTQLEKSREAVDAANIRAAYAEVMTDALTEGSSSHSKTVAIKQQGSDWITSIDWPSDISSTAGVGVSVGGSATITYTPPTSNSSYNVSVTYGKSGN